jgi:adenylate cyclase
MPATATDAAPVPEFQLALTREVLRSERLRVLVQAGFLALILVAILVVWTLEPVFAERLFHGRMRLWMPAAILVPYIAYELLVAAIVARAERRRRDLPILPRYLNAFLEASLPTIALLLQMRFMGAEEALGFWTSQLYYLFIILSTLRLDFRLSAFTGAVAALELFGLAAWSLPLGPSAGDPALTFGYHVTRSAVLLAAGLLAGLVGTRLKRQFESTLEAVSARDRVTNLFGQHVSPQVVERLLTAGPVAAGETRQVCVMFVDIRGFTAAASRRAPAEVVARLDAAFAVLVEVVDRHNGIVNKFLGDGFLAMFGAPIESPRAAQDAVAAAREMVAALARADRGSDWPLRIGVGIHIGEVVTGNVGSPRRKEYTVIGDTVNLASRIEALNKEFGSQILISDAVHAAAGDSAADATSLGPVAIRGAPAPVTLWRVA